MDRWVSEPGLRYGLARAGVGRFVERETCSCVARMKRERNPGSRLPALHSLTLEKVAEQCGHLAGLVIPLFARAERLVVVFGEQNMDFAFC